MPLELFEDIAAELSKPITVKGISTGPETALLMSAYFSEVNNAVSINPSAHHWQGTTYPGAPPRVRGKRGTH
ncbi:acyl-CoA thioester hydrolase/BAAT C-terminal domain-containing protein [Corynebacterium sp.]|uniref:acyl-CoA thioester hydrolase/BAAT C-terminal domain-containing protein n=1 Tax=Corynebacterium sp. TaxID=1720 RepID=UPI0026DD70C0|nr:acyl-CoA thioester hydrolase/BAAT C-terminal domain-containing protein [Corynebacterium sp.]MDO5076706.1 acyl-CoA thioester hydrolase/BAAT C-terminal domain-containing protein [Corynebacterium sp.]